MENILLLSSFLNLNFFLRTSKLLTLRDIKIKITKHIIFTLTYDLLQFYASLKMRNHLINEKHVMYVQQHYHFKCTH